jgi:hypothetical protein
MPMTKQDFLITPLILLIIYVVAYLVRPLVTDEINRRYFIPGLSVKILGALALGFIYQFYYGGGDTFTYFHLGSRHVWEAFMKNPGVGIKLLLAGTDYHPDTFQYATKIYTYGDLSSYFVVRVTALFDLLTFHTYSATACLFAVASFSGLWVLYRTFYTHFPWLHKPLAIAVFFVPSLFFWGSGLLKDSITIGALGWATWSVHRLFFERKNMVLNAVLLLASGYVLYTVKIYILLCFVPATFLWILISRVEKFRNQMLRWMIAPVFFGFAILAGYVSVQKIGESNPRYNLENLSYTAQTTAEWIHYVSTKQGGSAYTLGDFDYSAAGMVNKFPMAVWVTLFRPYVWEAHNAVMLLSALESLAIFMLTLYVIYQAGFVRSVRLASSTPIIIFCFVFTIIFAFAVGISTYNFGSLVRYKIPMLPYFISGLYILLDYAKREKYFATLASTE